MPTTRLAAILFTDIVGYTAMMQQNREQAMHAVRFYESHLKDKIAQHEGELLQTYGDGSLSIFDSASAAVQCAKELQEAIRGEVSLRIGIHLGEVTIDGEHIFGDGVNIASRVESMGVAGAVLVSSSIRQQIKNKPEFELESLGKFAFKNVAEPMTVYALTNEGLSVPKPEEMRGKGEKVNEKRFSPQSWMRFASLGFVAMATGAILFWALGSSNSGQNQLLTEEIREEKVAVGVFENFTGDEELDALGYLGSEWISSGLRELKIRTVSPEMVRKHKDAIGRLPGNAENQPAFSEITGAAYVVTGSYFIKKDSIVLNTRLISALNGEEIINFPELIGHQEEKEELVQEARQYIMGYWATKNEIQLNKIKPPRYKAYQTFLTCLPTQFQCFEGVLELDSNFIAARIFQMGSCSMNSNDSVFYKNHAFVKKNWDQTTTYEKLWFRAVNHWYQGDYAAYQEFCEEVYLLDENDPLSIHSAAFAALLTLNQPRHAIKRWEEIFDNIHLYEDKIEPWSYYHYMEALIMVGEYQKASDFYLDLPEKTKAALWGFSARFTVAALVYQDRLTEAVDLIEKRGGRKKEYLQAAFLFQLIQPKGENPFKAPLFRQLNNFEEDLTLDWEGIRCFDWNTKASAYYVLGEWKKAEKALLGMEKPNSFTRKQPYTTFPENAYWEKLWHTAMLGCVYARQGEQAKTQAHIQQLDALGQLYPNTHAAFHRGTYPYLKARIYAELGEKEQAVNFLQESRQQGRLFGYMSFTMDMYLVNLKDYPPFEELIRPKETTN